MDKTSIYKDSSDEWRWKTLAPNNRTIGASTEGYHNKQDCIENAKRNGAGRIHGK